MATTSIASMGGLLTSPIVLGASLLAVLVLYLAVTGSSASAVGKDGKAQQEPAGFLVYCRFIYANFIKPFHTPSSAGAPSGQQQALENFYQTQVLPHHRHHRRRDNGAPAPDGDETYGRLVLTLCEQASVYDATRRRLLRGREDMLGLLAAQLRLKMASKDHRPVWVDVRLLLLLLLFLYLFPPLVSSIPLTSVDWRRYWVC